MRKEEDRIIGGTREKDCRTTGVLASWNKGRGRKGRLWPQGASSWPITTKSATCTRCGNGQHSSEERCPAVDARCHRCNRKGHFSSKRFSKTAAPTTIAEVDTPQPEMTFLDTVSDCASNLLGNYSEYAQSSSGVQDRYWSCSVGYHRGNIFRAQTTKAVPSQEALWTCPTKAEGARCF